jgi:lipopolysaccharide/colanic/teichoic acid biosynthesis glycosyltransferase
MSEYHFDYELPQYDGIPHAQPRERRQERQRIKGIVFRDDTGPNAYYYDLATRHPVGARVKRIIDMAVSLTMITFLAPVFLLLMALIKLTSRGPIIFRQRRIGFRCNQFDMYKFRTMVVDADKMESGNGTAFVKPKNDPRVTPIGRFLRKYSLDELPQLFNVIRGEMSLVGPRPLPEAEDAMVAGYARGRLDLTPGVSGLWQVLGRTAIPFDEMVKLDYMYVTNWSLWLDLRLMLQTLPAVFGRRGVN